jgi:hypothetical protein
VEKKQKWRKNEKLTAVKARPGPQNVLSVFVLVGAVAFLRSRRPQSHGHDHLPLSIGKWQVRRKCVVEEGQRRMGRRDYLYKTHKSVKLVL